MTNICCPDCLSKNLSKYGKEPKYNLQKYQCKSCKRQFTLRSFNKIKTKILNVLYVAKELIYTMIIFIILTLHVMIKIVTILLGY